MYSISEMADQFTRLGIFLVRHGSHPAFGIGTADALLAAETSLTSSLAIAFSIWMPILSCAFLCIAIGEILSTLDPW